LCSHAAEQNGQVATGRDYYAKADFKKAAARFQLLCNNDDDAEACYWTGLSYERLADVRMPFGCKTDFKAHQYLSKATKLAPQRREYRDALFNFLLSTSDCSRTALREAAGILSTIPESDPEYRQMSRRLEDEKLFRASAGAQLGRLFLMIPRATYSMAALPVNVVSDRGATGDRREIRGDAQDNGAAMGMRRTPTAPTE
jgi:hypothetical protein